MSDRLERALQFDRDEIQAGIEEAESELEVLLSRAHALEGQIDRARRLLEGGNADLSHGAGGRRLTLHEAMRVVLREHGDQALSARELADEINGRDLYRKRDGSPVEINQIHARVGNYATTFVKKDGLIELLER